MTHPTHHELMRVADETQHYVAPPLRLPPADLETRETQRYLAPVVFFGEPVRYGCGALPSNSPHAIACALDAIVRASPGAAPAHHASDVLEADVACGVVGHGDTGGAR